MKTQRDRTFQSTNIADYKTYGPTKIYKLDRRILSKQFERAFGGRLHTICKDLLLYFVLVFDKICSIYLIEFLIGYPNYVSKYHKASGIAYQISGIQRIGAFDLRGF